MARLLRLLTTPPPSPPLIRSSAYNEAVPPALRNTSLRDVCLMIVCYLTPPWWREKVFVYYYLLLRLAPIACPFLSPPLILLFLSYIARELFLFMFASLHVRNLMFMRHTYFCYMWSASVVNSSVL